ncbi:hypothetical protein I656_02514 [Geobacillus sp. WSUCF1]|nr:hypothetical protein I656_02514 [Geobacillus sp. WSUCF1]
MRTISIVSSIGVFSFPWPLGRQGRDGLSVFMLTPDSPYIQHLSMMISKLAFSSIAKSTQFVE